MSSLSLLLKDKVALYDHLGLKHTNYLCLLRYAFSKCRLSLLWKHCFDVFEKMLPVLLESCLSMLLKFYFIFCRADEALSDKHRMKLDLQEKEGALKDLERK